MPSTTDVKSHKIQAQAEEVTKGLGGQLIWPGLLRKLDRADTSFRD